MLCKVIVCDLPGGDASTRRLGSLEDWDRQGASAGARRAAAAPGARPVPTSPAARRDPLPPDASCFLRSSCTSSRASLDLRSKLRVRQIANLRVTVSIAGFLASNPSADASL